MSRGGGGGGGGGGYTERLDCSRIIVFDWIFIILAGYEDNHISLNEYEYQPDSISIHIVSCP